jgi:hypothetical protein
VYGIESTSVGTIDTLAHEPDLIQQFAPGKGWANHGGKGLACENNEITDRESGLGPGSPRHG